MSLSHEQEQLRGNYNRIQFDKHTAKLSVDKHDFQKRKSPVV